MECKLLYITSILAMMAAMMLHVPADPIGCCWATQWEGVMVEKLGVYDRANNYASIADIRSLMHIDYRRKMVVSEMAVTNASVTNVFTIIEDFNKNITYTIVGFYCYKSTLPQSIADSCVPENANYMGSQDIIGVATDTWFLPTVSSNFTTARMTVAQENCVPIHEVVLTISDKSMLGVITIQNFTAGIVNASIFNVPPFCSQAVTLLEPPFATIIRGHNHLKYK